MSKDKTKPKPRYYIKKINASLYDNLNKSDPKILQNFAKVMMLKEHFIDDKKEFDKAYLRITTNTAGATYYELVGERKTLF